MPYLLSLLRYLDDEWIIVRAWMEKHRFYHNHDHLRSILKLVEANASQRTQEDLVALRLAAYFHDVVYDPRANDNEVKSIEMFKRLVDDEVAPEIVEKVVRMIEATIDHTVPTDDPLIQEFLDMDLNNLINGSLCEMIDDGYKIFKEFQMYDLLEFKHGRYKAIEKLAPYVLSRNPKSQINSYLNYCISGFNPSIAIYPGSFFPFHKGHLDVLEKAEKIFDKVIVAVGINPDKPDVDKSAYFQKLKHEILPFRQVIAFGGMLHDLIDDTRYQLTVVKGLRNPKDFEQVLMEQRYTEDMYPNIKMAYVISGREFAHVSSSGIKMIENLGHKEQANKYRV